MDQVVRAPKKVIVGHDEQIAAHIAADLFIQYATDAIKSHGSFSCALSGGSTPKKMFDFLTHYKSALALDWSKVMLFWSDERAVPPDDPESNYGMAMQYFSKPPFSKAKTFRMPADEKDLDKAANQYQEEIQKNCFESRFDLVLLGLGDDGHTASLFPHTKALQENTKLVVANFVPQKSCYRMTLTYPAINTARNILILVTGAAKAAIVHEIFFGTPNPEKYPAQNVGTAQNLAYFVLDHASAQMLGKK